MAGLPLLTSMHPPFSSVVCALPLQALMTMMSMVPRPRATSMINREFHQCFNTTMGVMLRFPLFSPFTFAFSLYLI